MKWLLLFAFFAPPILPPTGQHAKHAAPKVVMFTATYCGPCQVWKRTVKPTLKRDGIEVIELDVTKAENMAYQIKRLPTFWIIDGESHEWMGSAMVGTTSADELKRKIREPGPTTSPPKVRVPKTVKAMSSMSHAEMVELHNQLHGGGRWTWTGDLRMHLQTTHGIHLD